MLFLYKLFINSTNVVEKPIVFIFLYKKSWSILSNSFSWSTCTMHRFLLFSFASAIMSLIRNRLLKMVQFGMEHVCSSEIIFGKTIFNLFDKSLVSILLSIQRKEMGLQYFSLFRSSFIGMSVINSCLHCICGTFFSKQKFVIELY